MEKQFNDLIELYAKGDLKTSLDIAVHGFVAIERIQKSLKYNDGKLLKRYTDEYFETVKMLLKE